MIRMSLAAQMAVWATVFWLIPESAGAVPPPKTDQELFDMADLVVDAECVAVTCEGPPIEDQDKVVTTYRSRLRVSKTYKGDTLSEFEILGQEFDWNGTTPVGGWHQQPVPKGFVGKFYLQRLQDGTYTEVWWNAIQEDTTASHPDPLPACDAQDQDAGPVDAAPTADGGLTDGAPTADASQNPGLADRGCNCRTGTRSSPLALLVGLLFLGFARLRRRRPR